MKKVIIEPFRIKSVEPISNSRIDRQEILDKAFNNLFLINCEDVIIDL